MHIAVFFLDNCDVCIQPELFSKSLILSTGMSTLDEVKNAVKILNKAEDLQVFVSPQTVSLTVVGGMSYIANLQPDDISIIVDFKLWNAQQQFYDVKVQTPVDVIDWMDLSPKSIELVVTKRVG